MSTWFAALARDGFDCLSIGHAGRHGSKGWQLNCGARDESHHYWELCLIRLKESIDFQFLYLVVSVVNLMQDSADKAAHIQEQALSKRAG